MDTNAATLLDVLEASVQRNPAKPVIVTADAAVTYQQLLDNARRVGQALVKETTRPVVALFFPMSPEFITAFFGVQYSGKQALPLNLLLSPQDLMAILKD